MITKYCLDWAFVSLASVPHIVQEPLPIQRAYFPLDEVNFLVPGDLMHKYLLEVHQVPGCLREALSHAMGSAEEATRQNPDWGSLCYWLAALVNPLALELNNVAYL